MGKDRFDNSDEIEGEKEYESENNNQSKRVGKTRDGTTDNLYNISRARLANQIAGEISLSRAPGETIRKWRTIFRVSQRDISSLMGVMPSVVSDYENGRRKSPGIGMIQKIVNALLEADEFNGGRTIREFTNISEDSALSAIIDICEFSRPCTVERFNKVIGGELIGEYSEQDTIYGYTIVDSMKAIVSLSPGELVKIYGATTKRALVFTEVTRGRSPMIAIKVTNLKPSLVVLHGITSSDLDPLARRIAEVEDIPLVTCVTDIEKVVNRLRDSFIFEG